MSAPISGGLATGKLGAAEGGDDPASAARLISLRSKVVPALTRKMLAGGGPFRKAA